eukprot:11700115-Heterocapsa_arctica.AAC.1
MTQYLLRGLEMPALTQISVQRQSPSQAPKPENDRSGTCPKALMHSLLACCSVGAWNAEGAASA